MAALRLAFFGLMLCGLVSVGRSQEPAAKPKSEAPIDDTNEFAEKIVILYVDAAVRSSTMVLKDVEFKEVHGRTFITGVSVGTPVNNDWRAGKRMGLVWSHVSAYILFTAEEYDNHLKEANEPRENN